MSTMKTAEEWAEEVSPARSDMTFIHQIEQIQLDAYRAGMTEAAEIAHPTLEKYQNSVEPWLGLHDSNVAEAIEKAILTARDRKDLSL